MSDSKDEQGSERLSADADENLIDTVLDNLAHSRKRTNRMILTGAPDWVKTMIHRMHVARIMEVRDWSRTMPTRNPDEVISVLQRSRVED